MTSISEVTFEEYVNSSKAYVGVVMIIYIMYAVFDILRFFKTDGGKVGLDNYNLGKSRRKSE